MCRPDAVSPRDTSAELPWLLFYVSLSLSSAEAALAPQLKGGRATLSCKTRAPPSTPAPTGCVAAGTSLWRRHFLTCPSFSTWLVGEAQRMSVCLLSMNIVQQEQERKASESFQMDTGLVTKGSLNPRGCAMSGSGPRAVCVVPTAALT